jgi:hypothetical protein
MEDPPVTAETLDQFRKGMEVEVAEREKGKKFLASLKTPEAYRACQTELAMSPEMQKVMMSMGELPENATADQVQKHTAKVSAQMESLLVKKCGPDPGSYHPEQFVRAAVGKGQDASGLGKDDYTYHTWKEWVLEFCNYVEKLKKDKDAAQKLAKIKDEGLRIPGQGTGIYFVYSASEANLLLERCDALMPLINATI